MDATAAPLWNRSVMFRHNEAGGKKNQAQFRDGGEFLYESRGTEWICMLTNENPQFHPTGSRSQANTPHLSAGRRWGGASLQDAWAQERRLKIPSLGFSHKKAESGDTAVKPTVNKSQCAVYRTSNQLFTDLSKQTTESLDIWRKPQAWKRESQTKKQETETCRKQRLL